MLRANTIFRKKTFFRHKKNSERYQQVICPASLIGHWEKEAQTKFKSDTLSVLVYHGSARGQSARR